MRGYLRKKLTGLCSCSSGNAAVLVGMGLPVLLGAAGYAVETAQMYAWKRELQHSVDQAAIAGAWALAYDKNTTTYTTRAQQEFDANQAVTKTFADADATVQLGKYGGTVTNSVIVTASATKRLPFSGYMLDKSLTIFVRAQATYASGGTFKACLMALKEEESGTFTVTGSATVNAPCGLGALSCEDDAITIDVDYAPPTKGVTTDSIVTCGTAVVPAYLQGKVTEDALGLENPYADLPPPTPVPDTAKTFDCPKNGTLILSPGRYTGGMNMKCKVVMAKGIYVVDGGVLDMSDQNADVTGTGVMFLLRNGAQIKIGGSGNKGALDLTPMEAADFVGTPNEAYKDLYAGMLFYEDKGTQTSPVAHNFNGNAKIKVRGTFYLPNGEMTINGNSGAAPLCFQLWASKLHIAGNTNITTTCTSTETNAAGSAAGGVRLVA